MQSGTGLICVKLSDKAGFKFDEPAGDPAANCSSGTLVPVAQDFMPDGPGKFTYTMDWDGEVASVAVGKAAPSSNVASTNSANTPVDSGNSVSAQFLRYLEQAARDSAKRANAQPGSDASDASSRADTLRVVRGDLLAYVNASQTGFEAYKTGDVQLSQGLRMWTSSEKPSLATGCWVIQGATTSTFSCVIPVNANTERLNYTQLSDAVTASLPQGWSLVSGPPFAINLPSTGYRSSSGAHGEIWLSETTDGGYNLNFQLVSAPAASQAAKSADDDPIGEGGFITPPTPPPAPPTD
jgi:hypothetical protein